MPTPDTDIHRAAAADMFGVAGTDVTEAMRQRARTAMFSLIYAPRTDTDLKVKVGVGMQLERRREFGVWPQCPNCHQDATAIYAGNAGCHRCGWPAPSRKVNF